MWFRSTCLLTVLLLGACGEATRKEVELFYPPAPERTRFIYERSILTSADTEIESQTNRFRRMATGVSRTGRGLDKPFDVAVHKGNLYVSDTASRRVVNFNLRDTTYKEIGTEGAGRIGKPLGIAVDNEGFLFVTDSREKVVKIYTAEGDFIRNIGKKGDLVRPTDVAISPDGSRIFIVDTGGVSSQNHRVRVYDREGEHLFDIGTRGSEDGNFNLPLLADIGPDGNLYITDGGNFRIQTFDMDGKFIRSFGEAGSVVGRFGHPKGISLDPSGNIYVVDTTFSVFQIFDPEGRVLIAIGKRSTMGGPGTFVLPAGIAVDVDGRIYVADQYLRKVEVFRPAYVAKDAPYGVPTLPPKDWNTSD